MKIICFLEGIPIFGPNFKVSQIVGASHSSFFCNRHKNAKFLEKVALYLRVKD
jgi:hypothetical protein